MITNQANPKKQLLDIINNAIIDKCRCEICKKLLSKSYERRNSR